MSAPAQQLDLCDPYLAAHTDYRILEVPVGQGWPLRPRAVTGLPWQEWEQVLSCCDYDHAVRVAREHCLLEDREVWVVDLNAGGDIAFRVHPNEYTASGLALRPGA